MSNIVHNIRLATGVALSALLCVMAHRIYSVPFSAPVELRLEAGQTLAGLYYLSILLGQYMSLAAFALCNRLYSRRQSVRA